jgi:hypothetical protein
MRTSANIAMTASVERAQISRARSTSSSKLKKKN